MNAKELATFIDTHEPTIESTWLDSIGADEEQTILRALRLLAAAEGGEGTPDQSVMEVVSTVEDIVTAARLTQFYDDPIYKPWSEQVWRSVDTARRTIATRRKVLERIATERNGLAARVRELEKDAARLDWCQANHFAPRATLVTTGGDTSPKVWINDQPRLGYMGRSLREAIDAARSKP